MEEEFYPAYYRLEGRHWWFLGRRRLFLRVLEQQFPAADQPIDLLDFYRQVSPEQVLYASDYPYGQQPSSLLIAVRTARAAGSEHRAFRPADGVSPIL